MKTFFLFLSLALFLTSCGDKDKKSEAKKQETTPAIQIPKTDKSGPTVALRVSLSQLINTTLRENPNVAEQASFKMAQSSVVIFKLEELVLFLDTKQKIPTPLLLIKASAETLKNLDQNPLLGGFLTKLSDNKYKIKENPALKKGTETFGSYLLKVENEYALLIPEASTISTKNLLKSSAYQQLVNVHHKEDIASLSCIIPDSFDFKLADIVLKEEALANNRIAQQICKLFDGLLDQFKNSVTKMDYFALSFNMGAEKINLSLHQQFRHDAVGLETLASLTGDSQEIDFDFVSDIKDVLASDKLNKSFTYQRGLLQTKLNWLKSDSKTVGRSLGKLVMGSLFSVPDPVATKGKIETAYDVEAAVIHSVTEIKKQLPALLQKAAFPDKPYANSEQLTVHFEKIPGFGFGGNRLEYELLEFSDKSGKNIPLKPADKKYKQYLQSFIWVKFSERQKELQAGKLKIKLTGEIAPLVETFEFHKSDQGKVFKSKSAAVKLVFIDRDAVKILVKGSDNIKLIAYDKSGRVLKKKSVNGFVQNTKANYMGEVERLKVLISGKKEALELITTLCLTPVVLPQAPTD
ncbi:MAG: hypothetical protein HRT88_21870, partial [Lentisphaeraceae bacterium]|nr:hypothetical protein [Lentisphaeraceae bacterium]